MNNKHARGQNGMVATAKEEATKVGIEIIKNGGNAIDAAVAVGFALGVCEPNASGLGGGGFMTIRLANQETVFVDFREIAPNSSKPSMWTLDDEGVAINNQRSEGGKSICIPGEVDGLCHVLEQYGSMSLSEVIEPAISLAENGILVSPILEKDFKTCHSKLIAFEEDNNPYTKIKISGELFVNKPLAKSLKIIKEQGRDGFYKGEIAQKIVDSFNQHGGDLSLEDLDSYRCQISKPIKGTYRGYEILSSPPPSSGGTHIIQILNILEYFGINKYEVNSTEYIHLFSEVFKKCFADRVKYMGDPNFVKVPLDGLTSKTYAKKLASEINLDHAESGVCGNPFDYEPKDTTHYSIGDQEGNMVSVTKTISAFFGSGVVPKDTGIVLNCQMRGFVTGEGKANSVGPHKKPLSSMSPSLILKDEKPFAILGSPGGNRIIPIVSQVISKLIDHQLDIDEAVNSPRISNDHSEVLCLEGRIDLKESLEIKGHDVLVLDNIDRKLGGVQAIKFHDKHIEGAADPRRDGVAIGY